MLFQRERVALAEVRVSHVTADAVLAFVDVAAEVPVLTWLTRASSNLDLESENDRSLAAWRQEELNQEYILVLQYRHACNFDQRHKF